MVVGAIIKPTYVTSSPSDLQELHIAETSVNSIVKEKEVADNEVRVSMNCVASNPANKANKYYVNSLQGIEEECPQEQQSKSWMPDTATDITPED
eukprot:3350262-Lingulodinium_polyedra.AAC.1